MASVGLQTALQALAVDGVFAVNCYSSSPGMCTCETEALNPKTPGFAVFDVPELFHTDDVAIQL